MKTKLAIIGITTLLFSSCKKHTCECLWENWDTMENTYETSSFTTEADGITTNAATAHCNSLDIDYHQSNYPFTHKYSQRTCTYIGKK